MSQPETVDALMDAFFQERQPRSNLQAYVTQAEAAGEHQVAKILRAVIASDGYRDKLMQQGFPKHIKSDEDFFVCPHCGLIYALEPPEQCVADETPAAKFERIG